VSSAPRGAKRTPVRNIVTDRLGWKCSHDEEDIAPCTLAPSHLRTLAPPSVVSVKALRVTLLDVALVVLQCTLGLDRSNRTHAIGKIARREATGRASG
jgi:hypothetical protein